MSTPTTTPPGTPVAAGSDLATSTGLPPAAAATAAAVAALTESELDLFLTGTEVHSTGLRETSTPAHEGYAEGAYVLRRSPAVLPPVVMVVRRVHEEIGRLMAAGGISREDAKANAIENLRDLIKAANAEAVVATL